MPFETRHSVSGGEGRFTTRGDSVSLTGAIFFDGLANFSTSQNPRGDDGWRGAILFRDTGRRWSKASYAGLFGSDHRWL